jgi:uncharacterized damage-inducible protein DinB
VNKQDILDELIEARQELMAAIEGLTPIQMLEPGAVGIWSIKDVLAHLAAWESEMVTALNQVQNGRVPGIVDIDDIDEWNDEQHQASFYRPLDAVLEDLEGVHQMLLRMVEDFDEKTLTDNRRFNWMEGEPLAYLLEENAYLHEREHAEDIGDWRELQGI